MADNSECILVAAIDFGTTYSGYDFSLRHDFESNPLSISANQWREGSISLMSLKTPTCCLFSPDGRFDSFGFEAENKYAELALDDEHEGWYYFRRFKMILYDATKLTRDTQVMDDKGKSMSALKVFGSAINYLRTHLIESCRDKMFGLNDSDIKWVLTVPAIWNDAAKQFMREAAQLGGISSSLLSIALEPEAASLYCQQLPLERLETTGTVSFGIFKPGSKYLVLDAGGGTIDITIHEVQDNGTLRERQCPSGGDWGGTSVDKDFEAFLSDLVGLNVWNRFCVDFKSDQLDVLREFEIKKRIITPDLENKITIKMPISLAELFEQVNGVEIRHSINSRPQYSGKVAWLGDKLRVDASVIKGLFEKSLESIIGHVRKILSKGNATEVSAILMVGGFSESRMLQNAIRSNFPSLKVIIPSEAGLAVLKGAVMFGFRPNTITTRVSKYTYGIKMKREFIYGSDPDSKREIIDGRAMISGIFDKHIECDQEVKQGESLKEEIYIPVHRHQCQMSLKVFSSPQKCPNYVTDDGCHCLGEIFVDLPQNNGSVVVKLIHGGTELGLEAREQVTGSLTKASFDFLG